MVNWPVFPLVFLLMVIVRWWKKRCFPSEKGELLFDGSIALAVAVTATGLSHLLPKHISITLLGNIDVDMLRLFSLLIVLLTFIVGLSFNMVRNSHEDIRQESKNIKALQESIRQESENAKELRESILKESKNTKELQERTVKESKSIKELQEKQQKKDQYNLLQNLRFSLLAKGFYDLNLAMSQNLNHKADILSHLTSFYGASNETKVFEQLNSLSGLPKVQKNFAEEDREYVMQLRDYYQKYPDKERRIENAAKELLKKL